MSWSALELKNIVRAFEAIRFLHINGQKHGDIRNDHIIVEKDTGNYVWIDFDYDYHFPENPFGIDLFGIGKILAYVLGKGPYIYSDIKYNPDFSEVLDSLCVEDFSVFILPTRPSASESFLTTIGQRVEQFIAPC